MDPDHLQAGAGLLLVSGLTAATLLTVFMLRARRRQRRLSPGKQEEKKGSAEDDFEEINSHLQTDLKNKIIERINQVKADIKARKLQRDQNLSDLLNEQEMEISEKRQRQTLGHRVSRFPDSFQ